MNDHTHTHIYIYIYTRILLSLFWYKLELISNLHITLTNYYCNHKKVVSAKYLTYFKPQNDATEYSDLNVRNVKCV